MNVEDIWTDFLSKIKSKVSLMSYNYIFKDLKIHSYDDSKIIIVVPNNELLLQNITKNYNTLIEDTLNDITNDTCTIEYVFQKDIEKFTKKEKKPVIIEENIEDDFNDLKNYTYSSNFNPRHTFDTFIVGDSNKTHLMHAIGNYIVTHSDKRVLYITAEQFTNDYRAIINTKNKYDNNISYLEAFREKYRSVDVLMVDDIQFLTKRIETPKMNNIDCLENNPEFLIELFNIDKIPCSSSTIKILYFTIRSS